MDGFNKLIPCTETELRDIEHLYNGFYHDGNGDLTAAYLAVTELGFTDIFKSNRENTLLVRPSDFKFVIFSYSIKVKLVKNSSFNPVSIVKFHVDRSIFEGGGESSV